MRICTFSLGGDPRVGILFGERIADLTLAFALSLRDADPAEATEAAEEIVAPTCEELLEDSETTRLIADSAIKALRALKRKKQPLAFDGLPVVHDPESVEILSPVSEVTLFCMARNYVAHAAEMARTKINDFKEELPLYCFIKPATCINGPYDPVVVSRSVKRLDYELELGIVIGRGGRNIPAGKAMDHVGGYTLINDMSDRGNLSVGDNKRFIDWYAMKGPDGFAPTGPYILLNDEKTDPHKLRLRLWVNGELRQNASTGDMIWKVDEQVAYLSTIATLRPGDIIATGSPAGNAASWGKFLKPGDIIEGEISKIGRQRYEIKAERLKYTIL
ncbi:MAG: fumarylacetoacetate hydrolase family protein [Nitrospinota bacterium]|jgi:2-keto-4-pentenoate hydratase/2-oxohepta-3-ene-1,7-dioic acid hydratase in catechol pathway|nr:fumarylacetoacetate hydrolase family protein [Nitrospinota bacterium]